MTLKPLEPLKPLRLRSVDVKTQISERILGAQESGARRQTSPALRAPSPNLGEGCGYVFPRDKNADNEMNARLAKKTSRNLLGVNEGGFFERNAAVARYMRFLQD